MRTIAGDDALGEVKKRGSASASRWIRPALAIGFAVLITVVVILWRDRLVELSAYGYVGIFLISVIGNATVLFPVPSLVAVFAGGTLFHPLLVGLVSGVAEPIGELSGYMAGYGGSAIVENKALYVKLEAWMRRHGYLTIFVLSAIPNPVFDLAGIAAGALHFPVWKFLLACWLGKTVKAVAVAYAGAESWHLLELVR
jgi:uncharacterized membrane protein YdjX (TVP38/TMEM64 family)